MDDQSLYPDEAISTLLGVEGLPGEARGQLEQALGGSYAVRCTALHLVLKGLPQGARHSMTAEQLSVVSLGGIAAAEALADR
ncbi:hypothetical protein [Sinomonas terrae]|uniref:Uncharacterized protein n=1 Tax=Sinomonas terrae TaxID=2908838 RepID=A0ABS9U3D5_9MICC|nr:hypothetical protein [Sinomonas terrae]MCH6471173.1 hypothetical protein [Sinomonas terrae]